MTEYAELENVKARLGIPEGDTEDDALIGRRITSASWAIEELANRGHSPGFGLDVDPSARQYRPAGRTVWVRECGGELLLIDDLGSVGNLVVEVGDGTDWSDITELVTPDPLNAIAEGRPVTGLLLEGRRWSVRRVRVTERWGWPAIPAGAVEATELLTVRLHRRKDAPWGVAGFGESGTVQIAKQDPDVLALVDGLRRPGRF